MKSPSVRASALAPYALILLQNVIYGFGDPISKVAYDTVPVFSLLAARYLMAFAFLLLLFGKRTVQELKTAPRRQLILPCLCISSNLIGNVALVLTSATSVAFLRSLSTVIVPLLAGKNCRKSCCLSMCSSFWARTFSVVWAGCRALAGARYCRFCAPCSLQARCSLGREAWTA